MKSNAIMTRKMGEFDVLQRTSDGYFDANALLLQWNREGNNTRRRMDKFLDLGNTKEFIAALIADEAHRYKNTTADYQSFIISKGKTTKGGRTPDKVWMSPLLFIKFAMWINPSFEVQVLRFVYDKLIENRHLAGDNYNKLTAQLVKFSDASYSKVAQALNYIVFNKHYKNIRNDATPQLLKELHELEDKLAFSIEMGFITSYEHLLVTMRKMYSEKHPRF